MPRRPELLAEHRVPGARPRQVIADEALGLPVGDGDGGQVRLGLDLEILVVEMRLSQRIDLVRDRVGQVQIVAPTALAGSGRGRALDHDTTVAGTTPLARSDSAASGAGVGEVRSRPCP